MKKLLLGMVFLLGTCSATSFAAEQQPGAYASIFLGATFPTRTDVNSVDYNATPTASYNDSVEFDPGFSIGGTGGYDFGLLRLEGEIAYKNPYIDSITDKTDGYRFKKVEGNLEVLSLMGNFYVDLHNSSPITPYWGAGLGFASLHITDTSGLDTRGATTTRPLLYADDNDTVLAYQVGAGMAIALNRQLSLDFGYRYFATTKAKFDSDAYLTTEMKYESHNATVGLRMKF